MWMMLFSNTKLGNHVCTPMSGATAGGWRFTRFAKLLEKHVSHVYIITSLEHDNWHGTIENKNKYKYILSFGMFSIFYSKCATFFSYLFIKI